MKDITPTKQEERLARELGDIFSLRFHGRKRDWVGSLDISWNEYQAWWRVARHILRKPNARPHGERVSDTVRDVVGGKVES
jgi:cytochrome P450